MRRTIAVILTLAAIPAVAQMPAQAPGSRNPALVVAGTYATDPAHTQVTWTLDHMGFTPYTGLFGDVAGTLTLDPKNPNAAQLAVTIPVAKVVTASAALTAHMLRAGKDGGKPDFFGPAPADARFVSTRILAKGQTAQVTGDFTLNGVTKPMTLAVSFYGAGTTPPQMGGTAGLGFTATGKLRRSEFGLGFGVPVIGDEVTLTIAAGFTKR